MHNAVIWEIVPPKIRKIIGRFATVLSDTIYPSFCGSYLLISYFFIILHSE